jgi:hypothetical protein
MEIPILPSKFKIPQRRMFGGKTKSAEILGNAKS